MRIDHSVLRWLPMTVGVVVAVLPQGCSRRAERDTAPAGVQTPELARGNTSGGRTRQTEDGESGVGWSVAPKTDVAVSEALSHSTAHGRPDLIIALYTPQHDSKRILSAIHAVHGEGQRVIGMSTHEGILTPDGFESSPDGVVGVLTLKVPRMSVGVGGASFDEAAGGESARLALHRAIKDAGRGVEKPSMVLLMANRGSEEAMLAVLADEIGTDVPVIGGTAAGRAADLAQKRDALAWSTIANEKQMATGAAVAVFYTAAKFAYAYGGGFERVTSKKGIVTDADSRVLRAIDGRPALDVYDEWLGGRPKQTLARSEPLKAAWLVKNLEGKDGTSHDQFIHVFTRDNSPGVLYTEADVAKGDAVYPAEGSWNTLMNRFAVMPREARLAVNQMAPVAGLFIYCAGALVSIPVDQRAHMAYLVSLSMQDLPWLGVFSWGEQGHVQGVGNLHGNLMASTLLFPN
jgi:hypothetical protein